EIIPDCKTAKGHGMQLGADSRIDCGE
ncbi:MAG: hypothetical protein H6Q04_2713, partial [Acidobacteria bacterium]|nr:hypothetical protein [Acidobacteriota bacterium]